MVHIKIALLLILYGVLSLAAPTTDLPYPLKVTHLQLRSSLPPARATQDMFDIAEHYRSGDRWALSMTSSKFQGPGHSLEHAKIELEVIQREKQNRVILETSGSSSQTLFIVEVSLMIIGKQWEQKVIFLQNFKVAPTKKIRELDNGLLLTTASSHKLRSIRKIQRESSEVFILHRGFQGKGGLQNLMSLQGYFIDSQHIHIYAQLKNVISCYITLMVVNRTELNQLQLQLVQVPLQNGGIQEQNVISVSEGAYFFAKCLNSLNTDNQEECWLMRHPQLILEIRKISIKTVEDRPQFDLNEEKQLEQFSLHGRNRLLSPCIPGPCNCGSKKLYATSCYEDNSCKCKIASCGPGYYTTASLVSQCTPCPTNLTNCTSCALQYGTTNVTCIACSAGYTVINKVCVACPIGCATCTTTLVSTITTVTCLSCLSTLTLQTSGSIKICGCTSNQYLNTAVNPVACVTCPISCISCTSPITCTICSVGYYMSGTLCLACMPICKTCLNSGSCQTCKSPATLVMGVCQCPPSAFFDINTKTCLTCSTLQPNCQTCDYSSGSLNTTNPSPVVCILPSSGYYIQVNGSTATCIPYCSICSGATGCGTCGTNFIYDTGNTSCICNGLYFSSTQNSCASCSSAIPGCYTCQQTTKPLGTICQACNSNFFAASLPSLTCTACPSLCLTCTSLISCGTCVNNLTVISGMCDCNQLANEFLNPTTKTCELCSNAIFGCQVCDGTTAVTTCATAAPGFYISLGSTTCLPCPSTCATCTSNSTCILCNDGYIQSLGSCICDTACNTCLNNSGNLCSSCNSSTFACIGCAVGYYNPPTCTPCYVTFPNCADCTAGGCMACASTFTLASFGCLCDNSAGYYLSVNTLSCQPCSTVISNCQTCANAGPTTTTTCSVAAPGYYVSGLQSCLPCGGACLTCSTTSTHCITCLVSYAMLTPNNCGCNNTANLYYNPSTAGCTLCTTIIPDCQTCSTLGNATTCTLCLGNFYWNNGTSTCDACSPSCTTCSSPTVCTGCPNNLVLSQIVPGYLTAGICVCDNRTFPLTFYDTATETCEPCNYFYTTCTSCYMNGSAVLCSATSGSTYLVGGVTVNCPSPCSTCNSSGCLTCPTGMTPLNGSCICDTACTDCESLSVGCVSCSISAGAITSCSACVPGTYLQSPNCISCPATCATCTSSTTCVTCQPSYILIGSMCACPLTLGIFPDSTGVCTACYTIYYACDQCQISSGNTVCVSCDSGYYLSGGKCQACSTGCVTCTGSAITCTSCASGQTLTTSATCACTSASCVACNTISPNCVTCVYTIYGNFSKCETCKPDYYVNGANCSPCPSTCQSCGAGGVCLTCPNTFEVVGGNCVCSAAKNMWQSAGVCVSCSTLYHNCKTCIQNTSVPLLNVTCQACETNYFLLVSGTCTPSVCGDSLITSGQICDDGNAVSGDGCSNYCQVEQNFACTGQPSICKVNINFYITLNSITTSTTACNQFDISFDMYPVHSSYSTANFYNMLSFISEAGLTYKSWSYSGGLVTYTFEYSLNINKGKVSYYFSPKSLGVLQTVDIPLIVVDVIMEPTNNIQLIYYEDFICKKKENIQKLAKTVEYASYGTLIASALPCKIVGLELFGVLQLAHINVGNMDYVNTMMTPLMGMKGVHGLALGLGSESKKSRMLQVSGYTPSRVQSIGYESNFLRNCNLMLMVVVAVIAISASLYLATWMFQKCAPCLHSISKRIIKEVLLTLILFNCFNFAYSTGLHFRYAPSEDSLYGAGTAAALLALILPVIMAIALMCTEDDGFGEYKEKFKSGLVNRLYFVVTILYRTGIGLYISSSNEDSMSTLIVMALSIAFLLYNLVNLPYTKAYHNYRANVCHFTQFVCLFVAMYYRSMMSTIPSTDMANVFSPVYLEMSAIVISLVVSMAVLVYEIYLFVLDCMKKGEDKNKATKVSDGSSLANDKHITEGQLETFADEKKLSFDEL